MDEQDGQDEDNGSLAKTAKNAKRELMLFGRQESANGRE